MQCRGGPWEGCVGSGGHSGIERHTWTNDIHVGFNSIEGAIETISVVRMTQKERMQ